jgi:hypothetical protein
MPDLAIGNAAMFVLLLLMVLTPVGCDWPRRRRSGLRTPGRASRG